MNDLIVCMGCTVRIGLFAEYLHQLNAAGIDVWVEEIPVFHGPEVGGAHGWALELQRRMTQQFFEYDKIVFTDAWDVLFYGSKEDVLRKIPTDKILLGAERACYPDTSLIPTYPGTTPWRYVNGGLLAGTPENLLHFFDAIENHPSFDRTGMGQRFYNSLRHDGHPLINIDDHTELFYCLFREENELAFDDNDLPVNTVLGTHPNFLHCNGASHNVDVIAHRKRVYA